MLNTFAVDDAAPPADTLVLTDPFTTSDPFAFDGAAAESSTDPMAPAPFAEPALHHELEATTSDPANSVEPAAVENAKNVESQVQVPTEAPVTESVESSKAHDDIRSEPALVPPQPLSSPTVPITIEGVPFTHTPPVIMETPPTFGIYFIVLSLLMRVDRPQGQRSRSSLRSCRPASCEYT